MTAEERKKVFYIAYKTIEDGIRIFPESTELAVTALQSIADDHPIIKDINSAFKGAATLELKRPEKDAKVRAVHVAMNSMVAVLLQLIIIEEPLESEVDPHLDELLGEIVGYIKESGSLCDFYMGKTPTLKKFIKLSAYESRLAGRVKGFIEFADRLEHALSRHTVPEVVPNPDQHNMQPLTAIQAIINRLASPLEKDIRTMITNGGGARACIDNSDVLAKLAEKCGDSPVVSGQGNKGLQQLKRTLQSDLAENLDKALEQNLSRYHTKVDMLYWNDLPTTLEDHRDQIITSLAGGFKLIRHPDIQEIWKQMGWKITVKARSFVLALKDYYDSRISREVDPHRDSQSREEQGTDIDDTWAMSYIDISFLQPIAEAIDDDGSGLISVKEVRPDNLTSLDYYVEQTFWRLDLLLRSTVEHEGYLNPEMTNMRDEFDNDEETRLAKHLEAIDYYIDGPTTVSLVTGPGRIERYIYPLMYLFLQRHLKIVQLARTCPLDFAEFGIMADSLNFVFSVFYSRRDALVAIFKQMHIDPTSQFKNYAFGMFNASVDEWKVSDYQIATAFDIIPYESGENDDVDTCPDIPATILNCPEIPSEGEDSLLESLPIHLGTYCDGSSCPDSYEYDIKQYRYTCIVCIDSSLMQTLDFCRNCKGTELPSHNHAVSHSLIRSYRSLLTLDIAWMIAEARDESTRVKNIGMFGWMGSAKRTSFEGKEGYDGDNKSVEGGGGEADGLQEEGNRHGGGVGEGEIFDDDRLLQTCGICKEQVSLPCWVCLECDKYPIVCNTCDEKHQMLPPPEEMLQPSVKTMLEDMHTMHAMVWIRDDRHVEIPVDDQLSRVEHRLTGVERIIKQHQVPNKIEGDVADRLAQGEERMEARFEALESRFNSLEDTLKTLQDLILNSLDQK
ncbi:hypothetical protein C0991_005333 [Blastosporella zonata]|nr:hypothetical protein C0991_005333 [Blastosporella zonata]